MWDLFPCPETEPRTSALPVQSLSHREVPRDFAGLFCFPGAGSGEQCLCVAFFFAKVEKRKDYVNKCGTGNELTFLLYFQRTYSL